jgi:hypothetical protein
MRTLAIITFVAAILSTGEAQAAPWCAQYSSQGGGTNCGFYSFEQCMATVSGTGGFCQANPFENPYWTGTRQRSRRTN